jgi:hexokinase
LCTFWHTVPTSYELEVAVDEKFQDPCTFGMNKIWKGMYDGEVVAVKILRLHKDDCGSPRSGPDITIAKQVSVLYNPK